MNCLQFFYIPRLNYIFNLTQNTKIKNMAGVFSPQVGGLFLHSVTFVTAFWKPRHLFSIFEIPDCYFTCAITNNLNSL